MRRLLTAVLLVSAASIHAQQKPEPRHTLVPYTIETSTVSVMIKSDGTRFPAQKSTRLEARDSQGRRFTSTTTAANGARSFQLYDPLAGELLVWNGVMPLLKVLKFPTPIPGRSSCWQASPGQMHYVASEPQIQVEHVTCQPAEHNTSVYCGHLPRAVPDAPNNSPRAQPNFERCTQHLSSASMSSAAKVDDLGAQLILNREAYGCRETSNTADGTTIREEWLIELGTERTRTDMAARITSDSPFPGIGRVHDTSEVTSLKLAEPDAHSFQPPASYQRRVYEMVPCGSPQTRTSASRPH